MKVSISLDPQDTKRLLSLALSHNLSISQLTRDLFIPALRSDFRQVRKAKQCQRSKKYPKKKRKSGKRMDGPATTAEEMFTVESYNGTPVKQREKRLPRDLIYPITKRRTA